MDLDRNKEPQAIKGYLDAIEGEESEVMGHYNAMDKAREDGKLTS